MNFLKIYTSEGELVIYDKDNKDKITIEIDSGTGSASDTLSIDLTVNDIKKIIEYFKKQISGGCSSEG